MKNLKFKIPYISLILLFTSFIFINIISYSTEVSSEISDEVLRLHVIANSDSDEDQNLKYIVRDAVLEYMTTCAKDAKNKSEVLSILNDNIEEIRQIALNTVKTYNYNYNINLEIGNFLFPTKTYGDISLPSGYYDALKIVIGNGEGKNWWCVMFPPLCFVDVSSGIVPEESKNQLEASLSKESFNLVSTEQPNKINIKFKLVELWQSVKFMATKTK